MPGSDLTDLLTLPPDDGVHLRSAVVVTWSAASNQLDLGDGTLVDDVPHLTFGAGPITYAPGTVVTLLLWRQAWLVLGAPHSP